MDGPVAPRRTVATLGRAGLLITVGNALVNLMAYAVPVLAARRLSPGDLGELATALALVAIATIPGVGLQTAVAVATARGGAASRAARRLAWTTAACCGGVLLVTGPLIAAALDLSAAVPPLLAVLTVPAVLAGWPLGLLQGRESFGALAAGMVLLALGRYAGVILGLLVGAGVIGSLACGALVAMAALPPLILVTSRRTAATAAEAPTGRQLPAPLAVPAAGRVPVEGEMPAVGAAAGEVPAVGEAAGTAPGAEAVPPAGVVSSEPVPVDVPGGSAELRGRDVVTAAGASLAIMVASYADLVLARRLLAPEESGAYAVGAVLTRAAIWAPQMVTVVALPRLARARGRALGVGLALVLLAGAVMVAAATVAAGFAVRAVGGVRYAALADLAPYFVAAGALYAVSTFLINAQLAVRVRWPSAPLWTALAGLLVAAAVVRPTSVAQLLACALGAAAVSALATGAAVWWRRAAFTAAR